MAEAPKVLVSAASVYEGDVKMSRGRITGIDRSIAETARAEGFGLIAIEANEAAHAAALDHPHGDPFDRLIAAQARMRGMRVVAKDDAIAALGAMVVW
jgi:PIN domain nuclease of toxin-antitoxin system